MYYPQPRVIGTVDEQRLCRIAELCPNTEVLAAYVDFDVEDLLDTYDDRLSPEFCYYAGSLLLGLNCGYVPNDIHRVDFSTHPVMSGTAQRPQIWHRDRSKYITVCSALPTVFAIGTPRGYKRQHGEKPSGMQTRLLKDLNDAEDLLEVLDEYSLKPFQAEPFEVVEFDHRHLHMSSANTQEDGDDIDRTWLALQVIG